MHTRWVMAMAFVHLLAGAGCDGDGDPSKLSPDAGPDQGSTPDAAGDALPDAAAALSVVVAFPQLAPFAKPLYLTHPDDGTDRLFVVEQGGKILSFDNIPTVASAELFLDISSKVSTTGNEEGLLGLAFHPSFKSNGLLYLNYTADGPARSVISRFKASPPGGKSVDLTSEMLFMEVAQPFSNHNGGHLLFGPDGKLYIGLGDGGDGGDPQGHGQDRKTLLGSILRIDVDNPAGGKPYSIPADNPFVGNKDGFREEIWAYGLRNPWRFSFDAPTKRLWCADVGQSAWEEVDLIVKGGNYGWNTMEGSRCFSPATDCDKSGLVLPLHDYTQPGGQSVTGGHVYRGARLPGLQGKYIYADFISGKIWALDLDTSGGTSNKLLIDSGLPIASFGQDRAGELYICSFDGKIYHLE